MALPLRGLRVIDLTQDFAGPFCTMMLADLGAEVVKIEKPDGGDETRSWGPPWINGTSYYFHALNRGKKSVVLDLKKPEGQRMVRKLVLDSDILVESSRPGRMKSFHLDYPRLQRINKALVYCSISSFGQTGPYRDRLAYDIIAYAMSGIMASTGEPEGQPIRMSVPVADLAAGHYASTAILAALSRRLVTGTGNHIDIALYDSIVSWLTYQATYFFTTGKEPKRMGSAHPSIVPYQAFKCKDKPIIVAVGNDQQWKSLCKATEQERLADDTRFSTNSSRVQNRNILIPILQRIFRKRTARYWAKILLRMNVPATTLFELRDVVHDPHLNSRGTIVMAKGIANLGSPMKFHRTDKRQEGIRWGI